jgi:hypothetical protein
VTPDQLTTYTLECTGLSGSITRSVSVDIAPPPTLTLDLTRATIATGGTSEISWSATHVTSCVASGGWSGPRGVGPASETVTPLVSSDFVLTCTGLGDPAIETVRVVVEADRAVGRLSSWGEDVEIVGTLAIVASYEDGLIVLDLSNPFAPIVVESFDPGVCENRTPYGSEQLPFTLEAVEVVGSLAYLSAAQCGMWIVDLSDLSSGPLAIFDTDGWTESVDVEGGVAYVADFNGGVAIIDVADPSNPRLLTIVGYDDPGFGAAVAVEVVGDLAYVASIEGLRILDVTNPEAAFEIGALDTASLPQGVPQSVTVIGQTVYLPVWVAGLLVVDVSTPEAPTPVANLPTGLAAYHFAADGDRGYLAEGSDGVRVLDITNTRAPFELDRIVLGKFVWDVAIMNGSVVVTFGDTSDGSGGLQVIVDR